MDCKIAKEKNTVIIKLIGRLDSVTSPDFETKISEYQQKPCCNMLLDFDKLDYISSAGLRVVLNLAKSYREGNWQLAACNMQDHVREVFEISGFDSFVVIYDSAGDFLEQVCRA